MSSPIMPIQDPLGPSSRTPYADDIAIDLAALTRELVWDARSLEHDQNAAGPPPEVLDQIATAGRISRQLRECGHELRFSSEGAGRVTVELQDREGRTVRTMSATEAVEIAAGKPLE